ncbi:COMM domain-containing protein 6 isoform X2 [Mustela erminea]|uniref:COMM domain-containing protein 6 isoform X2 n=1 Tax=Mustela erminea TaxID=36723 RepID=UPI001386F229|nr:COMM domain-containing protein 6 isoform X2 [Mustela erminea]
MASSSPATSTPKEAWSPAVFKLGGDQFLRRPPVCAQVQKALGVSGGAQTGRVHVYRLEGEDGILKLIGPSPHKAARGGRRKRKCWRPGWGRPPGRSVVRALVPCHGGLQRAATGCEVRGHQPEFLQTVQGNCCSYRNCVKTDYLADKLLPSS